MNKDEDLVYTNSSDDDSSESDSSFSNDTPANYLITSIFLGVLRFHIEIDPDTLKQHFSLKLFQKILLGGGSPSELDVALKSVSTNMPFSPEIQPFINVCEATTVEGITEVIRTLSTLGDGLIIDNTKFQPKLSGFVTGKFVTYYLNADPIAMSEDDFRVFLSFIDLLLRNQPDLAKLDETLAYQESAYALSLTIGERRTLTKWLSKHPVNVRQAELERYRKVIDSAKDAEPKESGLVSRLTQFANSTSHAISEIFRLAVTQPVEYIEKYLEDGSSSDTEGFSTLSSSEESHGDESTEELEEIRENAFKSIRYFDKDGESVSNMKWVFESLFNTRRFFKPDITFYNRLLVADFAAKDFWLNHLDAKEKWGTEETKSLVHRLAIESIIVTDCVLADMELFLGEAGEAINDENVAKLLSDEHFKFRDRFIYSGFIDFYNYYRQKPYFTINPYLLIGNNEPTYNMMPSDNAVMNELFFKRGTEECRYRQYYNIIMMTGFLNRYPKVEPGVTLDYRFRENNSRVGDFVFVDKKVYSTAGNPMLWKSKSKVAEPVKVGHTYAPPRFTYDSLEHWTRR